jgi:hypothetical protein
VTTPVALIAAAASFHIAVFGDNHGDGPGTAGMDCLLHWIEEVDPVLLVGTGDHVSSPRCPFVFFLEEHPAVTAIFLPAVADAENAAWGRSQSSPLAGAPMLELCGISDPDGDCCYQYRDTIDNIPLAVLSLYFPDEPADPLHPFPEASRRALAGFLADPSLGSSFVLVSAHGLDGRWDTWLDRRAWKRVHARADVLVSGSTHLPFLYAAPAAAANAGSLTRPLPLVFPCFLDLEVAGAESFRMGFMDASAYPPTERMHCCSPE